MLEDINCSLKVNNVTITDNNSAIIWKSTDNYDANGEYDLTLPGSIVKEPFVERTVQFTSAKELENLRLEETVLFRGRNILEQWSFEFGGVKAKTVNFWKMVINAAPETQMMPLSVLSGKTIIKSQFLDGDHELLSFVHKLHYT